jgi:hypothetical protein
MRPVNKEELKQLAPEVIATLKEIAGTPWETLVKEAQAEIDEEIIELDIQVNTFERLRVKYMLTNQKRAQQVEEIIDGLRQTRERMVNQRKTLQGLTHSGSDGHGRTGDTLKG